MIHANALATQRTVADLIEEHDGKEARVEAAIAAYEEAHTALEMAGTVQGAYVAPVASKPHLHASTIRKNLRISGWKAIYRRLEIERVASAKDKQLFERTLADPPPLTLDNAKATFGDYLMRPRYHILRGLAEVFADLDPAYKSHSKVRIGVKGLPKRIILRGWGEYGYGYGVDRFKDVANALAAYQGLPQVNGAEMRAIDSAAGNGAILDGKAVQWDAQTPAMGEPPAQIGVDRGLTVRRFGNGNAHVIFAPGTALDINRALAEFYGEVLPDVEPEGVKPSASTAVSKDLQFYGSPRAVIEAALEHVGISHPRHYTRGTAPCHRILEPSCGDGRILDVLRDYGHRSLGIEYHPGRAAEAKAKGHAVVLGNFLDQPPEPTFDYVVMNPPFYGRHYVKHVRHALQFLKPGGTLVSVLPATAHYDHGELKGDWRDLPVGSFSEVGTNAPTGLLRIRSPK